MNERLATVAKVQGGVFSTAQAKSLGFSDESLRLRLSNGSVERCFAGVYRLSSTPKTFEQVCLAACVATGGALAGTTAGLVHGFSIGRRPTAPEIVLPHGTQYRSTGIVVHQTRFYPSIQQWRTGMVTTPAATMIALAKVLDRALLSRCLDHGIINGLLTVDEVVKELKDRVRFRGRRDLLSELAARSNGKLMFRSLSEGRVQGWIRRSGLPTPESNVSLETPLGTFEVDFLWRALKVILEVSPFYTHGSREQQERDAIKRRAVILAGYRIIEATDADVSSFVAFGKTIDALSQLLVSAE
jgi:hypothetical protein